MSKYLNRIGQSLIISALASGMAFGQEDPKGQGDLKYIDTRIGNVGALLQPTRPTVQLPNQVIRMYPMRNDHLDDQIESFPLTIVSHRLGEVFSLKPFKGSISPDSWKAKLTFDHDLEVCRPWYYSTYLIDDGTTVEFAPGKKSGIYRFSFDDKAVQHGLLFGVYNSGDAKFEFSDEGRIMQGMETYHGDIKIYVYGAFDRSGVVSIMNKDRLLHEDRVYGKQAKAYIDLRQNDIVEFRYAISFISAEQAKENFEQEVKGKSFSEMKRSAEADWAKVIGQVRVDGGTDAQRRTFYSALYRSSERMVDITENGRYYSGFDKKVHKTDRPFYVDDWTWDTYLALHPLRAILDPKMESDMLSSYVNMYEQSGWMPTFPVLFGDHACMNGFHSSVMFLDDLRKGIKGFDTDKAYEGMLKNATEATMLPWQNGPKTILDDFYYKNGYFPALKPGEKEPVGRVHPFEKRQAVAVTLGGSYDDWAVGEMAKELGRTADHQKFSARSRNYRTLWNERERLFMPKDSRGNWIQIDPKFDGGMGGREYYDENNGWTYMWQVQHDISGLTGLMGGKDKFEARLDQLFREPLDRSKYTFWSKFPDATGLVGQYSMGNEPSFHIPYLYNYTGSPWKTQKHIRFLLDVWFKDNIFGIPGDEDGGGMSAFVVFSSMGFYPITPGIPVYTIGSPVFSRVVIDLPNGKQFKVLAEKSTAVNKYIQGAKMNGQILNGPWFTHEQLINGGTLELEMGPKPNKKWGVQ